jgi:hypothetical protein
MAGARNKFELAGVVQKFGEQLIQKENLSPQQTKALYNILQCRTASLGGHEEVCNCCGAIDYSYNSCRNRHCPKCQGAKQAIWVEELINATLPVKHYHIIFTIPHALNDICLWNDSMCYNLLFSAVWRTLHSFGYTHYGAETGAVAVLHTWGQNLSLHPHIHCIVPAAGYSLKGEWKHPGKSGYYLYPVHELSKTFKGKFMDSLKRKLKNENMLKDFDAQIQKAYQKPWVVNSEPSMAKADHVIRYLGQYTHRIAISNDRLLDVSDTHVKFIAKDYRDKAIKKPVSLEGTEFLKRFCMHVMPKGFVRIRRYGIYNATTKRNLELQFMPGEKPDIDQLQKASTKEPAIERIKRLTGIDIGLCRVCKKGRMIVMKDLPRVRSPAGHLPTMLLLALQ